MALPRNPFSNLLGPTETLRGQLLRATVGSFAIKGIHISLQFTTSILLARVLGPEGFGIYSFALAFLALLTIPAQFGFPAYLVRMVAVYRTNLELTLLQGLLRRSIQIVAFASLIVGSTALLLIGIFDIAPPKLPTRPLLIVLFILPLLALLETNSGILRGMGNVLIAQIPSQCIRPAILLLLVVTANTILSPLTPDVGLLANGIATGMALLFAWWILSHHLPQSDPNYSCETASIEWARGALPFMLLAGTQVINHNTDILMLGVLTTQDQVGLYRVAAQVTDALGMALIAITAVITPHLATLHTKGEWKNIQKLLVGAHRAGVAMLLPVALFLGFKGKWALQLVYGAEYGKAAKALLILASGKVLYAGVGFSGVALSMFGLAFLATVVTGLTAATNVLLNFILIPRFGISGAALATSISAFVVALACILWMSYRYGMDFSTIGLSIKR